MDVADIGSDFSMSTPSVLYEDNHVIALFKPSGLLTQGDHSSRPSLLEVTREFLKRKYSKPGNVFVGLIHRLDFAAMGVVVLAKTSKGASRLSEQFRSRTVTKTYLALVEGAPPQPSGELRDFLKTDLPPVRVVAEGTQGAQLAVTQYETQKQGKKRSLLKVQIETGRKHQIRAQLSHLGTPIVGDIRYGAVSSLGDDRIGLVGYELSFLKSTDQSQLIRVRAPQLVENYFMENVI